MFWGMQRILGERFRRVGQGFAPIFNLGVRFWLGQLFFVASFGLSGASTTTLGRLYGCLAYVPIENAALSIGMKIVLGSAAIFLIVGLATRFASVLLLTALAANHFSGGADTLNLTWAVLLGWFSLSGGGAISLDRLLGRGAPTSAAPLAHITSVALTWMDEAKPTYLFVLRLILSFLAFVIVFDHVELLFAVARALRIEGQLGWLASLAPPLSVRIALGVVSTLLASGLYSRAVSFLLALVMSFVTVRSGLAAEAMAAVSLPLLFFVHGSGCLSLDRAFGFEGRVRAVDENWPRVVIVGAGFGGLSAAKTLVGRNVRVTIVDRHNHHLFQPLLYQVATAALSPADIATPIRELFRDQPNIHTLLDEVVDLDTDRQEVLFGDRRLAYDFLIIATGTQSTYFGNDEWEVFAPGLKTLNDAVRIRNQLLVAFERAEQAELEADRKRHLTFVVVGGGPAGVELAGAIVELARHGMTGDYRRSDPATARIVLVDRGSRPLKSMAESMSLATLRELEGLGVEMRFGEGVTSVDAHGVTLGSGVRIETNTVVWAAGVSASPAGDWLGVATDNVGRVPVGPQLSPQGFDNVFVVGDTAACQIGSGEQVPGLAPAAKQAGEFAARVVLARASGRRGPKRFRYRHMGDLATIGRSAAVVEIGGVQLSGALAWWLWGAAHVIFLTGVRNRTSVALHWLWSYLTYRRPTRLITAPLNESVRRVNAAASTN